MSFLYPTSLFFLNGHNQTTILKKYNNARNIFRNSASCDSVLRKKLSNQKLHGNKDILYISMNLT